MTDAPGSAPQRAVPADWRRAFAIQLVYGILYVTAIHASRPTVTYRALELGASTFDIGVIQAAFSLLPTLLAIPFGRWVDRAGEGAWLAIAAALMTGGSLLGTYGGSLLLLGISQLVQGLGQILYLVASQSLIANYGPRDGRETRFAHYATAHSVGQLLGPGLAALVIGGGLALGTASPATGPLGALLPPTTASQAFLVTALLTGAATLGALLLPRPGRPQPSGDAAPQPGVVAMTRTVMGRRGMTAAMAVSIAVATSVDMVIAYLPVYGETFGISVAMVGLLLTIRGVSSLVCRFFMGRLIAWLGRGGTLALSMVTAGAALLVLPAVPVSADAVLVVLMILAGTGLGLGQPMTIAWVAVISPRAERATALGVRITGNRASLLVIPPVLGAIAGAAGVSAIFVLLSITLLGGAGVAIRTPFDRLAGRPDRAAEPPAPAEA